MSQTHLDQLASKESHAIPPLRHALQQELPVGCIGFISSIEYCNILNHTGNDK
jgi:hypothetical protein